ncbi:MAG: hypothetical protein ACR2PM_14485 [Hyphomicrobiales bacterium]
MIRLSTARSKLLASGLTAAIAMLVAGRSAQARKNLLKSCSGSGLQQKCQGYASTALMQQQLNVAKSCGYKGAAWHGNYGIHFNWCMKASTAATAKETNARAGLLSTCN